MGKRVNQIIACYLLGCLLAAGPVAISPILHGIVEHANGGPAHRHHRGIGLHSHYAVHQGGHHEVSSGEHFHSHDHDAKHEHRGAEGMGHGHRHDHGDHSHDHGAAHEAPQTARSSRELAELRDFPAREEDHGEVSGGPGPERGNTRDPAENHHHDSLPQLLASGLVEQAIDVLPFECCLRQVPFFLPLLNQRVLGCAWDSQSASRAPPC